MFKSSSNQSFEQVKAAARSGDWAPLLQQLQQQLSSNNAVEPASPLLSRSPQVTEWIAATDAAQLVNFVLNALEDGDFQTRWEIAKIIPLLGQQAIAPLVAMLQDDAVELEVRWFITRILSEFDHPDSISALLHLIQQSNDTDLTEMAATVLASYGSSVVPQLQELIQNSDTRLMAVKALAIIRHSVTVNPLMQVVNDKDAAIRMLAIEALSSFHDPRVPAVLIGALRDRKAEIRQIAVKGLGMRVDLLDQMDLVGLLVPLLWDLNLNVCCQAALALGRLGTSAAETALFEVVRSPHTPLALRLDAIRALGWIETPTAVHYLWQALTEEEAVFSIADACCELITSLGRLEQPGLKAHVAHQIVALLSSGHSLLSHSRVKPLLALVLGQMQQDCAIEPLINLLADGDRATYLHALAALRKFQPSQSIAQLLSNRLNRESLPELARRHLAMALQEW